MAVSLCNTQTGENGRELVKHGSIGFPIAIYHDQLAVEHVPWHWHEELEAVVVVSGQAIVATDREKYGIREGEGFFINAETLHGAWDVDTSRCEFHSIVFHPRLIGGSVESVYWQRYIRPLLEDPLLKFTCLNNSNLWHQKALDFIEKAWQSCVDEQPGYEFQVRNILSDLILLFTSHHGTEQKKPSEKALRDGARIKQMLQYIQEHYAEELSINAIAQSANISESECLRCFRSTIGATPIQYTRQLRLQHAAEQLSSTGDRIADIANRCGFQEMSYFSKLFRQEQGITPSQYRAENS